MDILRHSCWALGGNFQGVVFLQLSTCLYAPCKAKERFPNKKRPCSENRKLLGGGGGGVVLKYGERKFLPSPTPSLSLTFVPRLLSGYALFQFWFFIFGSMDSSPSNQSFKSLNRCPAYLGAYSEGALLCHIGKKEGHFYRDRGKWCGLFQVAENGSNWFSAVTGTRRVCPQLVSGQTNRNRKSPPQWKQYAVFQEWPTCVSL